MALVVRAGEGSIRITLALYQNFIHFYTRLISRLICSFKPAVQ